MQLGEIIWRRLIDKVVQPVGIQEIRVAPPPHERYGLWIIIGKVVLRNRGVETAGDIPEILQLQRVPVILAVPRYEHLPSILRHRRIHSSLIRTGKEENKPEEEDAAEHEPVRNAEDNGLYTEPDEDD